MMCNSNKIWIGLLLAILFLYSCEMHGIDNQKIVKFTCQDIYIDTSEFYNISILFRFKVSNPSKNDFKFFANTSILNRDSLKSNFYILDTVNEVKFQLLLGPGPSLIKLYSGHTFALPVIMNKVLTWQKLKRMMNKVNDHTTNLTDASLILEFLKRSKLFYISNKDDFKTRHIDLKYLINDTIHIPYSDSTPVYFSVPSVKDFIDDSSFKKEHNPIIFLNR